MRIENVSLADFKVYSANKTLYIVDAPIGETYHLFDISGRVVAQGVIRSNIEALQIDCHSGIYILRTVKRAIKVFVR
jgi:hypothetical protein